MENKTYTVKGNKTAADAVAGNDEILDTGYSQEEAIFAAIEYQRVHRYVAAWIEEESKDSLLQLVEMADRKNDAELSAAVMEMETNGALTAFCKANKIKPGRNRNYRGAAFVFLKDVRDHLAL